MDFSPIFKKPEDDKHASDKNQKNKKVDYSSLGINKENPVKEEPVPLQVPSDQNNEVFLTDKLIQAREIYEKGVRFVSDVVQKRTLPDDIDKILNLTKAFIDFIKTSEQELIELTFSKGFKDFDPVALNLLNVAIYSLELGLCLDLRENEIIELGVASLLHDAGMLKCLDLASLTRVLKEAEYQRIKIHPQEGRKILEDSGYKLMTNVLEVAEQEHERMDGSGYPKGLKDEQINKFAKIIGFVDVYEALTHQRPYRQALDPLAAMKMILEIKDKFDRKIVKVFLENIGLCPRGTVVELNTKEVARVIKHNPRYPMAPKLGIILDAQKKKFTSQKEVDLSQKSTIHITKCL
ncbi:MAG: HD domain-containing protein [Candidatus Omnitrophica bacterium]|nr:HD domain-containing protein [Candidatus Omnitrophota bacterium]